MVDEGYIMGFREEIEKEKMGIENIDLKKVKL